MLQSNRVTNSTYTICAWMHCPGCNCPRPYHDPVEAFQEAVRAIVRPAWLVEQRALPPKNCRRPLIKQSELASRTQLAVHKSPRTARWSRYRAA